MEPSLAAEWDRIDLLCACLDRDRRGEQVPAEWRNRVAALQAEVRGLREKPPWQDLIRGHGLSDMDQEILACVVAPEAEPRLGWRFQQLQTRPASPYPSPALIRSLLFVDSSEAGPFHERLSRSAPLLRAGLIEPRGGARLFEPLHPRPRAIRQLLGWTPRAEVPPGAVCLDPQATWEDLVLPYHCLRSLKEFLLWITHRDQVEREWGARMPGGPVALFGGPSGTGKTLAAEVLARDLGWSLFRVDLGRLVSKYIGETEKNLNTLFDAAHGNEVILLFDEADSLFGKRGEIKDARDRYANLEVSHLLTRIESHLGPCLLTSNMQHHLDAAFARRFQAVIEFPRPDEEARERLWDLHLPLRAPRSEALSLCRLGHELNLTGGQIRNAALHAAFLAAGDESAIEESHIARAVWLELQKEGHEVHRSSLGGLAEHLLHEDAHVGD